MYNKNYYISKLKFYKEMTFLVLEEPNIVLKQNYFKLNKKMYKQNRRLVIGSLLNHKEYQVCWHKYSFNK